MFYAIVLWSTLDPHITSYDLKAMSKDHEVIKDDIKSFSKDDCKNCPMQEYTAIKNEICFLHTRSFPFFNKNSDNINREKLIYTYSFKDQNGQGNKEDR